MSADPAAGSLRERVEARLAADGAATGRAGVALVDTGLEALRVRDALIDAAEERIDAQYYIWNSDLSGRYLALRLLAAAKRGVRIRVLLDDINIAGRDALLAALAAHPNVAIRVYNPTPGRSGMGRFFSFAREFARLNRRMHNKSFTVDGVATILGGRNVGDEYFDLDPDVNFRDREVLVVGGPVAGVMASFDAFWASPWTLDATALGPPMGPPRADPDALAGSVAALRAAGYTPPSAGYLDGVVSAGLRFAPARLIADPPPLAIEASDQPQPVAMALRELVAGAGREVLVESAYLVLGPDTLADLGALARRGVRLRALTNSLASNDLVTNHSGYARQRGALLDAGIELHELRPDAAACRRLVTTPAACARGPGFSLHAKSLVVDRRFVYVGSFNVNLRSAYLNSETALVIDDPGLALQVADSIGALMAPDSSFRVDRAPDGGLRWRTAGEGGELVSRREPMSGAWRRLQARVYALFPLEKYL